MTTEEKAKAYDEALKVLHKYDGANIMFTQDLKEEIFPKLKESEDERIRKALISILKSDFEKDTTIFDISVGEIIAWLEKQCEQKPTNKKEEEVDNLHNYLYGEQKPADVDYNPFDDFRKSDSEIILIK